MMNTTRKFLWMPLAILVLLFATVGTAWAKQVKLSYAGTGWATTVDNFGDGWPITISRAEAKGSLGASRVEIRSEWMPTESELIECEGEEDPENQIVKFELIFSASVATFENQSQLFAFSTVGWMCANLTSGHYYGMVYGIYDGGSGKFAGATGEWQTDFDGYFLEPGYLDTIGFRSITGNVNGYFELPE